MEFKIGDTVQLKSGGPAMTISAVVVEADEAECKWFDRSSIKQHKFSLSMLQKFKAELTLEELICGSRDEDETHL